ncbi:hypothetical protein [Actinoallomurus iriomotensis]|uniref:Uncharacterized protein n=1 Tax=Actinoallomurus iriomotensis TaxID=478107 RepID=A0A9W6RXS1_9ACTN|nr:hypothetical protein [Actinoallomurus iriomotensis]GLY83764.1 hypothetical protein Airi02_016930 [Actinoallomurus iriomotensis]
MCPGWTADQLFEPGSAETDLSAGEASPIVPAATALPESAIGASSISTVAEVAVRIEAEPRAMETSAAESATGTPHGVGAGPSGRADRAAVSLTSADTE